MKKRTIRTSALLFALLLLAASLGGCATKSMDASDSVAYNTTESSSAAMSYGAVKEDAAEAPETDGESSINTIAYDDTLDAETGESTDTAQTGESLGDKMIYSADLSIQTTEYDAAISALESAVTGFGGFVESSNTYGDLRYNDDGSTRIVDRSANYTVRIPAERFGEFLTQANGLGNVLSTNRYAQNVTSQYTDYEARLSSLRTQEERLLSLLEKAEDVESLVALEERLADVRYETESIERNLRNLDRKIAYSTVTIYLQEVEVYTPTKSVQRTFGEKLSDALSGGWSSFTRSFQRLCINLVYSLPGIVLFLVIAGAAVLILLRLCRKYKARKAKKAAAREAAARAENGKEEN